jgi:uncharacterized membrane protein
MENAAQSKAKQPASALAGPYGHPFHASVVPVPIGAWVGALVLDVASRAADNGSGYARASTVMLGVGLVGAIVAALFGFMDYAQLQGGTKANRTATLHMGLNLAVIATLGASFLARLGSTDTRVPMSLLVLDAVALAVLGFSGWLGGKMSYRYGVRVADERTQAEGFTEVSPVVPDRVAAAGRVDRIEGTNIPVDKRMPR